MPNLVTVHAIKLALLWNMILIQILLIFCRGKKLKDEDIAICECKYETSDPESACGERCLNLLTSTECTPGYCPSGNYCKNQVKEFLKALCKPLFLLVSA